MKARLFILLVLLLPAGTIAQTGAYSDFFPFARHFDSSNTIILQCAKPDKLEQYPGQKMTPFQAWMTNLPLMPKNTPIKDWQGKIVAEAETDGIIDIPVDKPYVTDADLLVYLALNFFQFDSTIYRFNIVLTPKDTINYSHWLTRDYSGSKSGKISYKESGRKNVDNYQQFQQYLDFVLKHYDNNSVPLNSRVIIHNEIKPGNYYVQFSDDSLKIVSRVTVVLDVCYDRGRQPHILTAYGGNPAHSFVVPSAFGEPESKWLRVEDFVRGQEKYGRGFFYRFSN